jgi:transcription elongation factor Elf1
LTINLNLENYGDSCGPAEGGSCSSEIFVKTTQVTSTTPVVTCKQKESACIITWVCKNCVVNTGARIDYSLQQINSYSTQIAANVTSTSSIPGENSSVEQSVTSAFDTVYRGHDINQLYFEVTPSVRPRQVFITDSTEWNTDLTGYHIAATKESVEGSVTSVFK